ncbi:hypothetical protein PSN01_04353 [Micromonospora saelicesensis]|nr:hypothetical protein PSN01_04353 [Micromonospora saelicesensis]
MEEVAPQVWVQPAVVAHHYEVVADHQLEQLGLQPLVRVLPGDPVHQPLVLGEGVEVPAAAGGGDRALAALAVQVADPVQHGDLLGPDQQGMAERDVLVPAGEEPQLQLVHEVPADHLVPGGVLHPQQLRLVGQPGHAGDPAQQRAARVDLPPTVLVHAQVVEHQNVGLVLAQPVQHRRDRARWQPVVAVDEPDVPAGGHVESGVAGQPQTHVAAQVHDAHAVAADRVRAEHVAAAVRGGVVDGDQLDRVRLARRDVGPDRLEALVQVRLDAVHGHDDAQQRCVRRLIDHVRHLRRPGWPAPEPDVAADGGLSELPPSGRLTPADGRFPARGSRARGAGGMRPVHPGVTR